MIPDQAAKWLRENNFGEVTTTKNVGGGCINNGAQIKTTKGDSFFLKTNQYTPQDMFYKEAQGLSALKVDDGPVVPKPYIWGKDFLLMEDLSPAPRQASYWEEFGGKLANLHNHTHNQFGFEHDNYIGSTPQPNRFTEDGYVFFGEQRLLFQSELAERQGLLNKQDAAAVKRIGDRLAELVPQQPASLLHGDLWSGNAISDSKGNPALIDPAVYYGWAEAELAMTALFGAFPQSFYDTYTSTRPLESGYKNRYPIYNLYHLLNHLNLFGTGYLGQVRQILRKFT
jgi:protein-ribulosamine 3-kinase